MDRNEDIRDLEGRIDQLIDVCQHLRQENSSLKSENQGLTDDRSKLVEKTRLARGRIEDMIGRLKALERS